MPKFFCGPTMWFKATKNTRVKNRENRIVEVMSTPNFLKNTTVAKKRKNPHPKVVTAPERMLIPMLPSDSCIFLYLSSYTDST